MGLYLLLEGLFLVQLSHYHIGTFLDFYSEQLGYHCLFQRICSAVGHEGAGASARMGYLSREGEHLILGECRNPGNRVLQSLRITRSPILS